MVDTNEANGGQGGAIVAVSDVRNALPTPDLAGVSQVETQTHKIGLIYPPPDIRAIVDKTAQFVAKNGREFEKRILANEINNSKFNFLKAGDPYNAYYEHKIEETSAADKKDAGEPSSAADKAKAAAAAALAPGAAPANSAAPVAVPSAAALGAAPAQPAVPPTQPLQPPEEEQYTVHIPEGLMAIDLDVIKLTAQFVARNGKSFLTGLASREHSNPQFNFLKPTHSLFGFFTALCDAYSKVLMPPKGLTEKLEKDQADRSLVLERCLKRLEWDSVREKEAKHAADAAEAERMAMQTIDWHDFVVVETIEFYDDEEDELPPPMTLKEVIQLNKAGDYEEEEEEETAGGEGGAAAGGGAPQMDQEEMDLVAQGQAAAAGAPVPPPPGSAPPVDEDMDMDQSDEEQEAQVRVVKNYKRQDPRQKALEASKFVVSPITGELIPTDQMAEHMRISLIDPKWREQREVMLAKIKESTKASDDEINRNLNKLARTRPDIFGSTQEEMSALVGQQIQEARAQEAAASTGGPKVPAPGAARAPNVLPPPPAIPPPKAASPPSRSSCRRQRSPRPRRGHGSRHPLHPACPPTAGALAPSRHAPPPAAPLRPPPPVPAVPPPPGAAALPHPPPPVEEPDAKRQRTDDTTALTPEDSFLEQFPGQSKVHVLCAEVEGHEHLKGQLLAVEVGSLRDTIGSLKDRLADVLGVPANKQRISREGLGFLRDELSLAHYNVSPEVQLQLGVKERGGRKK